MAGPLALIDRIDVLFVGMGADVAHVPQAFRAALEEAGIGVEAMSSPPPAAPTMCCFRKAAAWPSRFCRSDARRKGRRPEALPPARLMR